ncbi:thermonuclease family protein [Candidatus Nanohalococcus occultus]|uniref:thermonuclease family protein n=1 Tax=Candidatus Nanohalococcus occultus TaxID=2978047 RepID=UPI0039E0B699
MATRRKPKKIVDGDTFKLHQSLKGKRYVRLSGIDTPEKGQFGYEKAKNQLKGMIGGKKVTIKPEAVKRRVIAEVYADGKSVNKRMKKRGW